jgi:hypothetical protein
MNKNDMNLIEHIETVTYPIMTDAIEDKIIHHWAHNVEYHREEENDGEMIDQIKLGFFGGLTYTIRPAGLFYSMKALALDNKINPHLRLRIGQILTDLEPATAYEVDVAIQYACFGYLL